MRTPSASLLVVVFVFASPAFAQKATPGTKAPVCSGDWGPGTEGMTVEDKANRLFRKLLDGAKGGVSVAGKEIKYDRNPELVVDLKNPVIGGSPAAAFGAGYGLNSPGKTIGGKDHSARDLVYTTYALYEMCDQPEATIFVAHEIGHLALGHAAKMDAAQKRIVSEQYDKWEAQAAVIPGESTADNVKRFFKEAAPAIAAAMQPVQAPLEQEADVYGRELSLKIGIPVDVPERAFLRAQDWLWGWKLDMADEGHGGTVHQRAVESAEWAKRKRAEKKQLEDSRRHQECALKGMSCP